MGLYMDERNVALTANERTPEYARMLDQERLILDASELVCEMMELRGVSKADLARLTGRTRAFVTQVLSGDRNMTLRTLADFAHALGFRITLGARLSGTTGDKK